MKPTTPTDAEGTPYLTITRYELLARDVTDALHAMMEELPKLAPKERRSGSFIRTHIGIPQKFVDTTVGAVEHDPELGQLNQMNLSAAYSTRQLASAFRPVVRELARVTDELQLLLDTRQANVAAEALKIYELAKALFRRKVHSGHRDAGALTIRQMKRDLGRRGPGKKRAGAVPVAPARKELRRPRKPRTISQRLGRRIERE
jgi:hypothetical protein